MTGDDMSQPAPVRAALRRPLAQWQGLPADMDRLLGIAGSRGLAVLEDAAQAHGASRNGRQAGSIGRAGAFSLQATKNLPTCGEGGLVTTTTMPDLGKLRASALRIRQHIVEMCASGRYWESHYMRLSPRMQRASAALAKAAITGE
ncbi:MAG TPA: DegT/DnrJ/EryC1/StrS family aminotransferase [Streptosporangiaceae bacterium]|nr:DegT/DnrJ/EryC1/StrS family aminotransferase [Streptosporangiaceae bacterium]